MTHHLAHPVSPLTDMQLKQLMNDLSPARVSVKQGMSYVEAWDVKATLIRIFGFGGFSSEVSNATIIKAVEVEQASKNGKMNWAVTAQATVTLRIHQLGATYSETAVAGSKQPDFTESADMALKSAESDALKRAAIFLGTQFGLSLYNNGATQDVIKTVLAPGQEWNRGARVYPETAAVMGAIVNGQRPTTAAASVEHLRPEGGTDEKHEQNMANLNSALSAQVTAQKARQAKDVPMVMDDTLSETAGDR